MGSVPIQGGHMVWLMDDKIKSGAKLSLAEMYVRPGEISEPHRHANCDETLHVVHGQICQRIGQDWHNLKAGDTCLIPKGSAHQTENTGQETCKLILAYSAGIREYEAL